MFWSKKQRGPANLPNNKENFPPIIYFPSPFQKQTNRRNHYLTSLVAHKIWPFEASTPLFLYMLLWQCDFDLLQISGHKHRTWPSLPIVKSHAIWVRIDSIFTSRSAFKSVRFKCFLFFFFFFFLVFFCSLFSAVIDLLKLLVMRLICKLCKFLSLGLC